MRGNRPTSHRPRERCDGPGEGSLQGSRASAGAPEARAAAVSSPDAAPIKLQLCGDTSVLTESGVCQEPMASDSENEKPGLCRFVLKSCQVNMFLNDFNNLIVLPFLNAKLYFILKTFSKFKF